MRSTTPQRLALCDRFSTTTLAQRSEPDVFLEWLSAKRFVVGGKLSSRIELRARARALRHLISRPDTPEIGFLSSELEPVALAPGDNRYQVSE